MIARGGRISARRRSRWTGVAEVWYWRRGTITPFVLVDGACEERPASLAVAGTDLARLARHLDRPTTSAAMRDYRAALCSA